jgi:hypothetical protein
MQKNYFENQNFADCQGPEVVCIKKILVRNLLTHLSICTLSAKDHQKSSGRFGTNFDASLF